MLPYTSWDSSGGPIRMASIHAYLLIDRLFSSYSFLCPKNTETRRSWFHSYKRSLCHLISIFPCLWVSSAFQAPSSSICNPQETDTLITLKGPSGFLCAWIWCCHGGTPEPRSSSTLISDASNPLSYSILGSVTVESRMKQDQVKQGIPKSPFQMPWLYILVSWWLTPINFCTHSDQCFPVCKGSHFLFLCSLLCLQPHSGHRSLRSNPQ